MVGNPRKDSLTSPRNLLSPNPVSAGLTRLSNSSGVTGRDDKETNGHAALTELGIMVVAAVVEGVDSGMLNQYFDRQTMVS
jgi:hypothetical protein